MELAQLNGIVQEMIHNRQHRGQFAGAVITITQVVPPQIEIGMQGK